MPTARSPWTSGAGRPLVVAHRGSSDVHAEHTLHGYAAAIEDGADVLECDVRLTADGHLVCVHDRRIDRTSDGRGVVSTKTLEQLRRQDFAGWKEGRSATVLLLEELILLALEAPRPVRLAIETKHPTRYAGLVEQRVVEMLRAFGLLRARYGAESQVYLMSFSEQAMRRWRDLAPGVPTVFLMDRVPLRCRAGWLPYRSWAAGPDLEILREFPRFVAKVHASGGRVFVWTVDEPEDVQLCLDLRVDALITNRPAAVRRLLTAQAPQ